MADLQLQGWVDSGQIDAPAGRAQGPRVSVVFSNDGRHPSRLDHDVGRVCATTRTISPGTRIHRSFQSCTNRAPPVCRGCSRRIPVEMDAGGAGELR